jgi:uncharacterized damage-inducible protein DinB
VVAVPLFVAPVPDERTALLAYLDQQRAALRAAVHGLSDEQATAVPSASSLSLVALIRHVVRTERRWVVAGLAGRPLPGLWPIENWDTEFVLDDGDTLKGVLDGLAAAAVETEAIVAEIEDLGRPCAEPESARYSARWVLLHLIKETARHAGHADIIRESLDGATARALTRATEG